MSWLCLFQKKIKLNCFGKIVVKMLWYIVKKKWWVKKSHIGCTKVSYLKGRLTMSFFFWIPLMLMDLNIILNDFQFL
jgi:hypothetical protein